VTRSYPILVDEIREGILEAADNEFASCVSEKVDALKQPAMISYLLHYDSSV